MTGDEKPDRGEANRYGDSQCRQTEDDASGR
jgi:hypothetical protein